LLEKLKAQIVRISYNTGIVPGGLWKITEEENCKSFVKSIRN